MIPPKSNDDPSWLIRARRELGQKEIKGANHNARILQYHQATKLKAKADEVSWCASFVGFCLEQEGVASTRSAAARSYATYGEACELKPGAILYFKPSDPDAGGTGHVGFCDYVGPNGVVYLIGGNQRNRVGSDPRPIASISACRWPVFS